MLSRPALAQTAPPPPAKGQTAPAIKGAGQNLGGQYRTALTRAGITDPATQDSVLAYAADRQKNGGDLRDKFTKLREALTMGSTDGDVAILLNDYKDAIDDEKASRKKAEAALDAKIGYSKNPRLESALLILGLVGDAPQFGMTNGGRGGNRGNNGGGQPGPNAGTADPKAGAAAPAAGGATVPPVFGGNVAPTATK